LSAFQERILAILLSINNTTVLIRWKAPKKPAQGPLQGYQVDVLQETFKEMFLPSSSVTVGPNVTELELTGLRPSTNHLARVAAYNEAGMRYGSQVFFTTAKKGKLGLFKSFSSNLTDKLKR